MNKVIQFPRKKRPKPTSSLKDLSVKMNRDLDEIRKCNKKMDQRLARIRRNHLILITLLGCIGVLGLMKLFTSLGL